MLGTNPGLPEFNRMRNVWVVPDGLLHAAWVARYEAGVSGRSSRAITLGGTLPAHLTPG